MSKIITLYRSILKYAGLDADAEGFISTAIMEQRNPTTLNGLRLVLPLDQQLKSANPAEKIIFHPLSENILRGESEIIGKLREVVNIRLNYTIGVLGQSLLNLAASPDLHHKLSPDQSEMLFAVKDADETSVTNFINVMLAGIKTRADRVYTNIFLKKGGSIRGKRHARVGIVSFPIMEELEKEGNHLFGVKVRVKDKKTFKALMQYIIPMLDTAEQYNYGSDSNTAPYLDALMNTSMNIAGRLNDIIEEFKDYIDKPEQLMFDSEWVEVFSNLEDLVPEIRRIPVQVGNEGRTPAEEEAIAAPTPTFPVPMTAPAPAPIQQPAPTMYPQAPYGQPQPYPQAPRPEVRHTKRGLDFASIKQVNPGLAMTVNPLSNQLMQQNMMQQQAFFMQQQQQVPGWARQPPPMPMQGYPGMQYPGPYPQAPMQPYPGMQYPNPYPPNYPNGGV